MWVDAFYEGLNQQRDLPVVCADAQVRLVQVSPNQKAPRWCRKHSLQWSLPLAVTDVLDVGVGAAEPSYACDVGVPTGTKAPIGPYVTLDLAVLTAEAQPVKHCTQNLILLSPI